MRVTYVITSQIDSINDAKELRNRIVNLLPNNHTIEVSVKWVLE